MIPRNFFLNSSTYLSDPPVEVDIDTVHIHPLGGEYLAILLLGIALDRVLAGQFGQVVVHFSECLGI